MATPFSEVWKNQLRFLCFRSIKPNLSEHHWHYLSYIFIITWLVGIGRYWDHPKADWWQYAGLGSLAYIFVLSTILYLVVWPLRPKNWSYLSVLVFVGLTSLPALLYATPVERFMPLDKAQLANAWFLAVVAIWRVALLLRHLIQVAKLNIFFAISATFFPIGCIIIVLAILNLEHVVFNIMAGVAVEGPNDLAYTTVIFLAAISFYSAPLFAIMYCTSIVIAAQKSRRQQGKDTTNDLASS